MRKQFFKKILFMIQLSFLFGSSLQTPQNFLGFELGNKFTFHHDAISYFKHISEASSHINFIEYGRSYEDRPLVITIIKHPKNNNSFEQIRTQHLISSGLSEGEKVGDDLAVVWLSYSVHGNESSSMEAAIKTLYSFADTSNEKQMKWLEKVIVIIDP